MNLSDIKGIGPKTLGLLNKLSIYTIDDLIRYYPYRYNTYSPSNILEIEEDTNVVISGIVTSTPKISYIKRNFNKLNFTLETNNVNINVSIFNRAFLSHNIYIGKNITLIGKYNRIKNTFTASDIKLYGLTKTEVEPVYHMINGLKTASLKKIIYNILTSNIKINEIVPEYLSNKYEFIDTKTAIREIHFPSNTNNIKQAKLKLKYEELFAFMFKINLMKFKNQIFDNFVIKNIKPEYLDDVIDNLPFALTSDQLEAVKDIISDFNHERRMNRLILGDVGSGKTIVSFIAILLNQKVGYQSAMLAPTEVLAHQHYDNFKSLFPNINVAILVGSQTKKEKETIIEELKQGNIDLLIGTHAILEENVEFKNIGLVITDEQHRFGVNQRKKLQNKGQAVDVLYMSATPIPRTYALTIYGDMDISMIKQKPSGRKDILTKVYKFDEITKIIQEIEEELSLKHQVYVIAPLIEENEDTELNDILKIEGILKSHFKNKHNIGTLHGKMKASEKDAIMNNFKSGKLEVLVSTTVIEVGVDVQNATMIAIFNAERFGLATLHQLRGRVGRNSLQSKCLLISDKESERLHVLEESNDGFYISECDFKLRGSGDLFGIRQSGDMVFKIADIHNDYKILLQCKSDSQEFLDNNIENNFRDYAYYRNIVDQLMNNN
ncbi:MAG: ATP-dependent DNA helicase RecG [Bacilli bacterium]|nr:ATP-dependent DNA helicase RecG [Bacilli bacterium]